MTSSMAGCSVSAVTLRSSIVRPPMTRLLLGLGADPLSTTTCGHNSAVRAAVSRCSGTVASRPFA
jgi:hypothetical protein